MRDTDGIWNLLIQSIIVLVLLAQTIDGCVPAQHPDIDDEKWVSADQFGHQVIEEIKLKDSQRNKELLIRVTYPDGDGSFPLIIWSHGMYGSKDNYQPLVKVWAQAGYVIIQPTHSDSLSLLSPRERLRVLAESRLDRTEDWPNRPVDVQFILDSIDEIENRYPEVKRKIDFQKIGVGGHSFGAVTAQLIAGTVPRQVAGRKREFTDRRPIAFVAISPNGSGPFFGGDSFKAVDRPILFVSGCHDKGRLGEPASWRREVFDGAPAGDKYLAWLVDAHHNFGGIAGTPPRMKRFLDTDASENPRFVQIVATSTLVFWDAYLKSDPTAKNTLKETTFWKFPVEDLKWERK